MLAERANHLLNSQDKNTALVNQTKKRRSVKIILEKYKNEMEFVNHFLKGELDQIKYKFITKKI